jgi:sulfite exporter TauE/SafE
MKAKKAYWIGGTLTAFLGVGLVRLLAPALVGVAGSLATAVGYVLVIAGITIIARATRRNGSEPIETIEHDRPSAGN